MRPGDPLESIRAKQQALSAQLLARAVARVARGDVTSKPQPAGGGRQYYRMHPRLRAQVERKLADGGYRPSS